MPATIHTKRKPVQPDCAAYAAPKSLPDALTASIGDLATATAYLSYARSITERDHLHLSHELAKECASNVLNAVSTIGSTLGTLIEELIKVVHHVGDQPDTGLPAAMSAYEREAASTLRRMYSDSNGDLTKSMVFMQALVIGSGVYAKANKMDMLGLGQAKDAPQSRGKTEGTQQKRRRLNGDRTMVSGNDGAGDELETEAHTPLYQDVTAEVEHRLRTKVSLEEARRVTSKERKRKRPARDSTASMLEDAEELEWDSGRHSAASRQGSVPFDDNTSSRVRKRARKATEPSSNHPENETMSAPSDRGQVTEAEGTHRTTANSPPGTSDTFGSARAGRARKRSNEASSPRGQEGGTTRRNKKRKTRGGY